MKNKKDSSFLHPIALFSGGEFGRVVGGTFLGVPILGSCLTVIAKSGGVEANGLFALGLGLFAGVGVSEVVAGPDNTDHGIVVFGQMVAKLKTLVALGAGIEAEKGCDPKASPKEQKAFEGLFGVVVAHCGQDHGRGWFPSSLVSPSTAAWDTVEGVSWVEVVTLLMDLGNGVLHDEDIVNDNLGHLYLFLEVDGGGQNEVDHFFKWVFALEQVVGGGGKYSKELYILLVEDFNLCICCLAEDGIHSISQKKEVGGGREGGTIADDQEAPVAPGRWGRSVGVGGSLVCLLVLHFGPRLLGSDR